MRAQELPNIQNRTDKQSRFAPGMEEPATIAGTLRGEQPSPVLRFSVLLPLSESHSGRIVGNRNLSQVRTLPGRKAIHSDSFVTSCDVVGCLKILLAPNLVAGGSHATRKSGDHNTWRSYATKKTYQAYLTRWVLPHWRQYEWGEVRTIQVESWLRTPPLAKSSCAKIRNLMSVLFNHACRYQLFAWSSRPAEARHRFR